MSHVEELVLRRLIATQAIRVRQDADAPPFWYTSGLPGPFYTATQNLIGQAVAPQILAQITYSLATFKQPEQQAAAAWSLISKQWHANPEYDELIRALASFLRAQLATDSVVISGGERRDWFFSIPIAQVLNVPHLAIFKSGASTLTAPDGTLHHQSLGGREVVHVADIINQGSSYLGMWLPAISGQSASISTTLGVVARSRVGINALEQQGLRVLTALQFDMACFERVLKLGAITEYAFKDIQRYLENPASWVRHLFTYETGALLTSAANADARTRSRIQTFISIDPYSLREEFAPVLRQLSAAMRSF